eukprot:TRINITY_DN6744_c0_g1_i2.p1 TRINITY_DN6744_c0_g1~~TRINITY_DN6744_c0_g1_i2.p1  ORF type:complete len:145 (+),score=2.18 TRINITY_DN6744_c0_g1_i2:76-510(+)
MKFSFLLIWCVMASAVAGRSKPHRLGPLVLPSSPSIPSPLNISNWIGKNVMMVSAHPDDIENCAGATVSLLTQLGIQVYYVIVTNGDKGCSADFCLNFTAPQIAVTRQVWLGSLVQEKVYEMDADRRFRPCCKPCNRAGGAKCN